MTERIKQLLRCWGADGITAAVLGPERHEKGAPRHLMRRFVDGLRRGWVEAGKEAPRVSVGRVGRNPGCRAGGEVLRAGFTLDASARPRIPPAARALAMARIDDLEDMARKDNVSPLLLVALRAFLEELARRAPSGRPRPCPQCGECCWATSFEESLTAHGRGLLRPLYEIDELGRLYAISSIGTVDRDFWSAAPLHVLRPNIPCALAQESPGIAGSVAWDGVAVRLPREAFVYYCRVSRLIVDTL